MNLVGAIGALLAKILLLGGTSCKDIIVGGDLFIPLNTVTMKLISNFGEAVIAVIGNKDDIKKAKAILSLGVVPFLRAYHLGWNNEYAQAIADRAIIYLCFPPLLGSETSCDEKLADFLKDKPWIDSKLVRQRTVDPDYKVNEVVNKFRLCISEQVNYLGYCNTLHYFETVSNGFESLISKSFEELRQKWGEVAESIKEMIADDSVKPEIQTHTLEYAMDE